MDGVQHTLKGTLTLVPGDNLASQCLGGYKSLSSALRKCRQCMATNEDMQAKVCLCMCVCTCVYVCVCVCVCMHVCACLCVVCVCVASFMIGICVCLVLIT